MAATDCAAGVRTDDRQPYPSGRRSSCGPSVPRGAGLAGFVHVLFDDDDRWGSLIDNLHVTHDRHRTGIGTALLTCAAEAVAERATGKSMYLWVLEQNTAAQRFYRACGGACVERAVVSPPGGVPARLNGSPGKLRFTWSEASLPVRTTGH